MTSRENLMVLTGQLEEMWGIQNTLFEIINDENLWDHKHGPDWTFADPPYHLAYCNHDLVARPIEMGRDLPKEEQLALETIQDVIEFNDRKFAERAPDVDGFEAWGMLKYTWEEIRNLTAEMSDEDLRRPYWFAFMGGQWLTVRDGLQWMLSHDWSEFMQLRIHMGRKEPVPSPVLTRNYLAAMIGGVYPMFFNSEAAEGQSFTANMNFTDPEVGDFSLQISDGAVEFHPHGQPDPDLVLIQSAETFERIFRHIQSIPEAIASGDLIVNDPGEFERFEKFFPVSI